MNMKEKIKCLPLVVGIRLLIEHIHELTMLARNIGTSLQHQDVNKYRAAIRIKIHSLEKGMSIGNVKVGFGQSKAINIINELQQYINLAGVDDFVYESISILHNYIDYNKALGANMTNVSANLAPLVKSIGEISNKSVGGINQISLEEITHAIDSPFDKFSQWRYSVRDFGNTPIDKQAIECALKLCERTPSACNRQSWRIHIYYDEPLRTTILKEQGGNVGFAEGIQCAILVCSDLRCYGFYETKLPYVDGAMYAMNLLYALTHQGLATIPLTMGIKTSHMHRLKKVMGIPDYEIPVLLIGVGTFKEQFKVAKSHRIPYSEYVIYNQ